MTICQSIFRRDMCVVKNTSQPANVRGTSALQQAECPLLQAGAVCRKTSKRFFDSFQQNTSAEAEVFCAGGELLDGRKEIIRKARYGTVLIMTNAIRSVIKEGNKPCLYLCISYHTNNCYAINKVLQNFFLLLAICMKNPTAFSSSRV